MMHRLQGTRQGSPLLNPVEIQFIATISMLTNSSIHLSGKLLAKLLPTTTTFPLPSQYNRHFELLLQIFHARLPPPDLKLQR